MRSDVREISATESHRKNSWLTQPLPLWLLGGRTGSDASVQIVVSAVLQCALVARSSWYAPGEGVECAQLRPAGTELFGGIVDEAANVCTNMRDAKQLEAEHARDGQVQVLIIGIVIARPVACSRPAVAPANATAPTRKH